MLLKEFLKETLDGNEFLVRPAVICADGFLISVQGSIYHYCEPKETIDTYESLELSCESDSLLTDYQDECGISGWVPVEIVEKLITKHGGIVEIKD